jgi:7,8-dihydropterin-6-yl-methyl-4-(beta-D-ribofuranosyl)aminobenzene 5'-phosphate synthase
MQSAGPLLVISAVILFAPPVATAIPAEVQITVLYDAFGKPSDMQKDWGYAALVEYGGKRILFDTGNNPDFLAQNAKGVDLTKLDFVDVASTRRSHGRTDLPFEGEPHGEDLCT